MLLLFQQCPRLRTGRSGRAHRAESGEDWQRTVGSLRGEILQAGLRYRLLKIQKGEVLVPGRETLRPLVAISGVKVYMSPELERCGLRAEAVENNGRVPAG